MKKAFVLIWGVVGIFFLFIWIYLPSISKYHELKLKQDELDEQIQKVTSEMEAVREERDLLKNDPGYLEKTIRDELGLVKPGEIVYKFVEENPGAAIPVNSQEAANAAKALAREVEQKNIPPSAAAVKSPAQETR